ncbi:P2X purinoceptor 4-like [Paramacrobiotus metropolitanus]|uniref:P2X purinoceptor 4-like n=1 Tax=Paramacrobiotus metropolitanus TaxID=2943436 RepID=UPI00244570BB|nr:P2X purinoceptor 4-like [Paramacrobiotus metropolitanus]
MPHLIEHHRRQRRHCRRLWDCGNAFLFEYETPRLVTVRSCRVGVIYRIVQMCIVGYLIGYVFCYMRGYQDFEMAQSSVVTKIKGMMYRYRANSTRKEVWDGVDFVVPPQESDAFFIATSLVYTANQTQGQCPEDPNVGADGILCHSDDDCAVDEPTPYGNGLKTGRCVVWQGSVRTCEINAWCPTEIDKTPKSAILHGFETVTVLVKNHVAFPKFDKKRRNILDSINQTYLQSCRYDPHTDPLCPVFSVAKIVQQANVSLSEIAVRGGIIGFDISWNCDFDYDEEYCVPHYSFRRLDNKDDKVAKGWNFRHAYYYYDASGIQRRDLVKLWGIRFVFNVNGRAYKFSPVNFAMNLGSGLGLLGIASVVCEFVLLNCLRSNDELIEQKFTKLDHLSKTPHSRTKSTDLGVMSNSASRSRSNSDFLLTVLPHSLGSPRSSAPFSPVHGHGPPLVTMDDV